MHRSWRLAGLTLACLLLLRTMTASGQQQAPARIDPQPGGAARQRLVAEALGALERGDQAAAHRLLERAARAGLVRAQVLLGDLLGAEGAPRADRDAALHWYRTAALQGSEQAEQRLRAVRRALTRNATGIEASEAAGPNGVPVPAGWTLIFRLGRVDEGIATLIREAETLYAPAHMALEILYRNRVEGGPPAYDARIREYFERSAREGIPRSLLVLGRMHANGWGVPRDDERALAVLRGTSGLSEARLEMASIELRRGNQALAEQHWRAAGEMSDPLGWYQLGVGQRKRGAHAAANHSFRAALELDPELTPALVSLAQSYMDGLGVDAHRQTGLDLYERAAALGDPVAQFALGRLLVRGVGDQRDEATGRRWLEESARQHFEPAVRLLEKRGQARGVDSPR